MAKRVTTSAVSQSVTGSAARRSVAGALVGRRLVVVAGKGGVGRTTVAAALGIAAARQGQRTIVCEVSGRRDVPALLAGADGGADRPDRGTPTSAPDHLSIDRTAALEEYLGHEVPGPLPGAVLARSRAFSLFVEAAPGLAELLTIGKVWQLTQPMQGRHRRPAHDVVVLDGPASGQLIGLLAAPRTFGTIARAGPVAAQTAAIEQLLRDPEATGVITVATPEQMAVTEALELSATLTERLRIHPTAVVVNRLLSSPLTAAEAAALAALDDDPAVRSARWLHARARAQRVQLARLRKELPDQPCIGLPFLFGGVRGDAEMTGLVGLLGKLWR